MHAHELVISNKVSKNLLSLKLNLDYLNDINQNDFLVYEDDKVKIHSIALRNVIKHHFSENINENKKTLSIEINLLIQKRQHRISESSSDTTYKKFKFALRDLISPIFLKESGVNFTLKNYQLEGIAWLLKANGRILADDMGLGKTAQSISASTALIKELKVKSVLILCPSPLVENWLNELSLWAPSFCSISIRNTGSKKKNIWKAIIGNCHFVVTNYEQLRGLPEITKDFVFDLIICDEAHKLRKSASSLSKNIKKISYKRIFILSGTPIEKDANDLINLLNIINPKANIFSLKKLSPQSLRAYARKDILRRMKNDVLDEMKDLNEEIISVPLSNVQENAYNYLCKNFASSKQSQYLSFFTSLKQLCDIDPRSNESSKLDYAMEIIEKIIAREEKCVVFSFYLLPLEELKNRLDELYGKSSNILYEGSLKLEDRNAGLNTFANDKACKVFLCSGKLGGEGLNLVSANHAIFINEWWNPSNNAQARDRIFRIGQLKNVNIYKLRTINTIESRVAEILEEKDELTDNVIEKLVKEMEKV